MYRLFQFIYKYRSFLFFLFLELVCGWLVIQNNEYQSASFFNSSNTLAATVMQSTANTRDYFDLKKKNRRLLEENALLRERLERLRQSTTYMNNFEVPADFRIDRFEYEPAEVVNKSLYRFTNYLTIDKGQADGIKPGMGVVSAQGVVGKVKAVSPNYASVISLLHSELMVSSLLKRTNTLCTTKWESNDPSTANLLYVPRHLNINEGDTVVTSGYNAVFPQNIPVGIVRKVTLEEEDAFYNILINLSTDFTALSFVYVIKNELHQEQDSLELQTTESGG